MRNWSFAQRWTDMIHLFTLNSTPVFRGGEVKIYVKLFIAMIIYFLFVVQSCSLLLDHKQYNTHYYYKVLSAMNHNTRVNIQIVDVQFCNRLKVIVRRYCICTSDFPWQTSECCTVSGSFTSIMFLHVLLLLHASGGASSSISCYDGQGKPVDWFVCF